jgi:hypothetical protein
MDRHQHISLAGIVFGILVILNVVLGTTGSVLTDMGILGQLIGAVLLIGGGIGGLFLSDQSTGEMIYPRLLIVLSWGGVVLFAVGMILGHV